LLADVDGPAVGVIRLCSHLCAGTVKTGVVVAVRAKHQRNPGDRDSLPVATHEPPLDCRVTDNTPLATVLLGTDDVALDDGAPSERPERVLVVHALADRG